MLNVRTLPRPVRWVSGMVLPSRLAVAMGQQVRILRGVESMTEIIDFQIARAGQQRDKSTHLATLDIFQTPDGDVWANSEGGSLEDMDRVEWSKEMAVVALRLAWLSQGQAAELAEDGSKPIAVCLIRHDGTIHSRFDGTSLETEEQWDWLRERFAAAVDAMKEPAA
jgi:hypothetical protein